MFDPISLGLAAGGLFQGLFNRPKSYLDDPAFKDLLAQYGKLATDPGATAEVEKYFAPARSRLTRDMTALGPPGASGAVSGALAGLYGDEATAKTDLMRRSAQDLLNIKLGLGQTYRPQAPQIDFGGLAAALSYYKYLKGLPKGLPGAGTGVG